MTNKSKFTDEEWETLQFSFLWVFHAIALTDGIIDEHEGKALLDAFKGEIYVDSELAKQIVASTLGDPQTLIAQFKKDQRGIPMGLKEVAELVENKLDLDTAKSFKLALLLLGVSFAKASNQVGTRGVELRISKEEQAAILTIAAILRLSTNDLKQV